MDWGRAKNVLILTFLLLNILLGYQLWGDIREQLNANKNTAELPPETLTIMKQKRIELDATLPLDTPKLRDLTYQLQNGGSDRQDTVQLKMPVDSRIIFTEKDLLNQLGGQIPDLAQYRFDLLMSTDQVFVLYKMVDNHPMFDVRLELYYSNQKITAYKQMRVEVLGSGEAKEQTVLPASKAVAPFIERNLPNGSIIRDIQLGYHGQTFDTDTQVSAPYWRVVLEDGLVYYIHAISGEVAQDKEHAAEKSS
ncbi:two-component system regulatory protein YycI [Paenibacillus sp. NPDC058071]|uniref:two-component system regulatory protein YycI n=1 Tax=Paenibacillus sp. NPDC058071 TaxID=3346326 RepID=UPI0036DC22F1